MVFSDAPFLLTALQWAVNFGGKYKRQVAALNHVTKSSSKNSTSTTMLRSKPGLLERFDLCSATMVHVGILQPVRGLCHEMGIRQ